MREFSYSVAKLVIRSESRDTMTEKHRYQLERWKLLINERVNSGCKVKDWCDSNGLSKDAYYYWLREIRRANIETALENLPTQVQQTSFVEISKPEEQQPIELGALSAPAAVIRNGTLQIDILQNASGNIIRELVKAVSDVQA